MERVLVLIDYQNGLPADLVIKRGSSEFSHPLDYLGVPFRCYRCHGYGHLMNECLLPFNKNSSSGFVHKIWWVKNCGSNLEAKEGLAPGDILEDLNLSHKTLEEKVIGSQSSLSTLKPLCITSLSDGLGWNNIDKEPTLGSLYDSVHNEALRDLGLYLLLKCFLL